MAAIDFPAAPTVGQIFASTNGMNYQWNGTLWLAVGPTSPTTPGGDFFATGTITYPAAVTVAVLTTVQSGNSGGWYSTSTGRFTPPAGRYFIYGGAVSSHSTSAVIGIAAIYKNGVEVSRAVETTYAGTAYGTPALECVLDANGTDYFTLQTSSNVGANVPNNAWFGAFPISGIKGPPGDPGQLGWRVLSTQSPAAAANADFPEGVVPSDINNLMCTFDLTPTTNDVDLLCQFYNSSNVLDVGSSYASVCFIGGHTGAAGATVVAQSSVGAGLSTAIPFNYSATNARVSNVLGIRGHFTVPRIRTTTTRKAILGQAFYYNGAATGLNYVSFGGDRAVVGAINGLRLTFSVGTMTGTAELWGSP